MDWLRYFFSEFVPEVISEMKKVTFPSRDEVIQTSIVVIITSFIFAFYLWAADLVIVRGLELVYDLMGAVRG
ncbi:MAG: preprotein translocase subunit SecE [Thermoanaerobaculia bacterium]|nr:preprotein translocase subunit SecE [Thermoanaerobaculia bacterium]